jgi:hypothetical protein
MVRPRKDGKPSAPCKNPEGRPEIWTIERIEAEADAFMEWTKKPGSLYYKEFVVERGYAWDHVYDFILKSDKFARVLKYVHSWQESKLSRGSLLKKLDGGTCRLLLGRYGIKEQQEIQHSGEMKTTVTVVNYNGSSKKQKE